MAAIISVIFGLIEFLVGFRFAFLLLGANPDSSFVSWIYQWSTPLVTPFTGIFGQSVTTSAGAVVHSTFDPSSLVALIVYATIGGILIRVTSR